MITAAIILFVTPQPQALPQETRRFLRTHCVDCHASEEPAGGLNLATLEFDPAANPESWEHVVRKLQSRQMPPLDQQRPKDAEYKAVLKELTTRLDAAAKNNPRPGRIPALRRLTRFEYQNAIRDLLHLEIDATKWLPKDESSHGFDNITVGELSPTLLNRYVTAAQRISRLALGGESKSPAGETLRLKGDLTQEEHVAGLPFGTRGGTLINYTFPRDGIYEIQATLARDRNEEVEGLYREHEVVFLIDRAQVKSFTVRRPKDKNFSLVDAHLKTRLRVKAGPRKVGVTFVKDSGSLLEEKRQPYDARFNMHRHRRTAPALFQVSITGPFESTGSADSPSRRRVFEQPGTSKPTRDNARRVLSRIIRRAFRRPISDVELSKPMTYFDRLWRDTGGTPESRYERGLELAIASVLISPQFLFKIERDAARHPQGSAERSSSDMVPVPDIELASRLSFFLWSSIPDDELLSLAEQNQLSDPDTLAKQVQRLLDDPKAESLTTNFASQWLYLRNLDSITPDLRQFPDFDDNLRQSFRRETELLFSSVHREDRSVLELLSADYTFLNERLAKHYGIPHIRGSRFRRVELDKHRTHRGGLLRQGSILTVTSYATRTSPVIRGHWILKNLLGSPPPPPPANVPDLKDNTVDSRLSVRERLAEHRANQACASCHNLMDPVGFALENYDAVGRWRVFELGEAVDASGGLPGREPFVGVLGLEQALLANPQPFVQTFTEKLLTYALGRGVRGYDGPTVRMIAREAKSTGYRFSSIIHQITRSVPFRMRSH